MGNLSSAVSAVLLRAFFCFCPARGGSHCRSWQGAVSVYAHEFGTQSKAIDQGAQIQRFTNSRIHEHKHTDPNSRRQQSMARGRQHQVHSSSATCVYHAGGKRATEFDFIGDMETAARPSSRRAHAHPAGAVTSRTHLFEQRRADAPRASGRMRSPTFALCQDRPSPFPDTSRCTANARRLVSRPPRRGAG